MSSRLEKTSITQFYLAITLKFCHTITTALPIVVGINIQHFKDLYSPHLVNPRMMHYINDSLENQTISKDTCCCDEQVCDYCYHEELGPFYPGQTVEFYFIISFIPTLFIQD